MLPLQAHVRSSRRRGTWCRQSPLAALPVTKRRFRCAFDSRLPRGGPDPDCLRLAAAGWDCRPHFSEPLRLGGSEGPAGGNVSDPPPGRDRGAVGADALTRIMRGRLTPSLSLRRRIGFGKHASTAAKASRGPMPRPAISGPPARSFILCEIRRRRGAGAQCSPCGSETDAGPAVTGTQA